MMISSKLIQKLKDLKPSLKEKYPIESLALFGSYSRGEQSEDSDIDLLVSFNGRIGIKFIDLAEEIEKAIGIKIDLVSRRGIKDKYFTSIKDDLLHV